MKYKTRLRTCVNVIFLLLLFNFRSWGQQKARDLPTLNRYESIFELKKEQIKNPNRLLRFSAITNYRPGVITPEKGFSNLNNYFDPKTNTITLYMYNLSIVDILTLGMIPSNEVVLKVKNPNKYQYNSSYGPKLEWTMLNTYCFEYTFPKGSFKSVEMLNSELCHYFGVKMGWEVCLTEVLVLTRTSKHDKIKSLDNDKGYYDLKGKLHNVPLSILSKPLIEAGLPPLIDETNYNENVNIDLKINSWADTVYLRKRLHRYNLDLKSEKREREMFVIKELNNPLI